jgi:Tfp pilus assembly protein PilX
MSFLRRLLRRQDGITLIMAIGVLGVLTMAGTSLIYYSSTNARMAALSEDKSSAYDLAEAGINEMMAILSRPENNALNKYILGEQANGTVTHTTQTYDGGTVEWWGTLSQSVTGASTWTLTSIGKVKNPTAVIHAAAQQPVLEFHLLARDGKHVRHDDSAERAGELAALRRWQPLLGEYGGHQCGTFGRPRQLDNDPERQLRRHLVNAAQSASCQERLQVEEQRSAQPMPAGSRRQRLRQRLGDRARQHPCVFARPRPRLGRLVPERESRPLLQLSDHERYPADL